jgi:arsenate reductase
MAEGFARHLLGQRYNVYSAGTHPQRVNPLAIRAMSEVGIDISNQTSKSLASLSSLELDIVITVCDSAHQACPVFAGSGTRVLHRAFDDPPRLAAAARNDEEALPHYRRIRDEIREFVQTLPSWLQTSR